MMRLESLMTTTAAPTQPITAEAILAAMRLLPAPPPDVVVVTPSLDALMAAVGHRSGDIPPLDGIPVYVTKFADRPKLVPRAWLRSHHIIEPVPLG